MDNNDYFESLGPDEEQAMSAKGRVELLRRQTCTRFEPHREYFAGLPVARVRPARPAFTPTASRSLRDHLQPQRQVKYLRGVLPQDYCQQTLEELLGEEQHQPVRKLRNTSALVGEAIYWAEQTVVQSARLADFLTREKAQGKEQWAAGVASPKMLADLHEWIYELAAVGQRLYARTPRAIFALSLTTGEVQWKVAVEEELVNWHHRAAGGGEEERLLLTTYQDRFSQLYEQGQEKLQLWCKLDGLVNSLWSRTTSEVVLCKENAVLVADRRKKKVHELQRRARAHENRIYAGLSLASTVFGNRYFATTESFEICVYDMRSPHDPILKMPHYCQEAPPSVLQAWSSSTPPEPSFDDFETLLSPAHQWREENPLLIAHSPYAGGSSLFTELSVNWETPHELVKLQFSGQANQFANRFRLLYDPGKMQEHYHPRAISAFQPAEGEVGFLHLDNFHGLSLEIFQRVPANLGLKNYKSAPGNFVYQRVNLGMQEAAEDLRPANQEWFQRHQTEKQLEARSEGHLTEALSDEEGLELQEEPFEQRVVRFADLRQFFHRVHGQAQEFVLPERIKQEQAKARKDTISVREVRMAPTQSQTQQEENKIREGMRGGHLSEQAIGELLDEWGSL